MHKIKIYSVRLSGLMSMLLMLLTLLSFSVQAQDKVVSGKVTSATTGETLPGVSVLIKGTATGTVTNLDGDYKITLNSDDDVLVFSFIGMKAQEMSVGGRSTIDVGMLDDITSLEEIVVVGYGSQKKSVLTAAISSVKAEDLANFSAGSVDQALQGRMAGVQIVPTSGSPGAGYDVKIRGAGSNGNTSPLYIVDGMRVPDISWLDPFEIEAIEVLKDAASAAIYGAEGANGVVYVTTKQGVDGPGKISYDFQFGLQSENSPLEVMNLAQFDEYNTEAGISRRSDEQVPTVGTNWKDEIFDTAPLQRHALTFSGGNADTKYMFGGYFLDQEGIVGGEKASINRYGLRFNLQHKVNDWAKITSNYSFAKFERQSIQENSEFGGIVQSGIVMDPATPVVYANGIPQWITNEYGADQAYKTNSDGLYWGMSALVDGETSNPLAKMEQVHGSFNATVFSGATAVTISPIEGLEVTSRLGIISGNFYNHYWQEEWFFNDRDTEDARVADTYSDYFNYQWENFASYTKQLGENNFNVLVGTSYFETESGYLTGNGTTLLNAIPQLAYLDAVPNRLQNTNAQGNRNTNVLNSYFGRLTYNYKEKYLFSATMRADGSSVLSENNRWGYFPSVSAGWVLSSEDFFGAGPLNFLKVRASWGENGSLSSLTSQGAGASLATVSAGFIYEDASGNFLTGAEPVQLANPNLTWETSVQTDFGIDIGLFEDRLTASADYFIKDTKDLIVPGSPPSFVGNPAGPVNSGEVRNKGIELELGFQEQKGDFKYDVSVNFTAIKNEATFVDPNKEYEAGADVGIDWNDATAMQQGFPIWFFRGYQTDGIFQNDAEVTAYTENVAGYTPSPGDPVIVDTDGDGTITPSDFVQIGTPHPDFTFGTTIELDYKGFDFKIFAQGSIGNDVIMGFNRTDRIQANKPEFFYNDRWTGEGSTNSWFRAGVAGQAYTSDLMVFDGSFFKIRQMQLGYNLPKSVLDKAGLTKLRLYVSLDNFFTFTKYKGFDPEIGGSNNANSLGIDRGSYPVPKTFVTGLTLQF